MVCQINTGMTLDEIFEKALHTPNQSDKQAIEMSYPNIYKNKKIGGKKKVRREKVVVRSTATGKIYGERTVVQKNT